MDWSTVEPHQLLSLYVSRTRRLEQLRELRARGARIHASGIIEARKLLDEVVLEATRREIPLPSPESFIFKRIAAIQDEQADTNVLSKVPAADLPTEINKILAEEEESEDGPYGESMI